MQEEESGVERVQRTLFRRGAHSTIHSRRKLHRKVADVSGAWSDDELTAFPKTSSDQDNERILDDLHQGHVPDNDPLAEAFRRAEATPGASMERTQRRLASRFVRTLFIASAVFFILTGGLAANFLLFSGRQVSCDNITIDVRGPASIPSGKELLLNVSILNQNIVPIEGAEIVFEYPEGTRSPENTTIPLPSQREQVGTIESGEPVRATGRAVLYGKEQTEYEIMTRVEFTIKDSNASWDCEVPYKVALATAPVGVTITGLRELSSGQQLELVAEVTSNSEDLVRDVRLVATYPFGFDFISANPKPTTGEAVWDIGDITPGTKRTITIRGQVTGYGTEARTVDFAIGEASGASDEALGVILQTTEHPFLLTRPFLATKLTVNDTEGGSYSTPLGGRIDGTLTWTNELTEALHDVQIEAKLPGIIVDRRSVQVNKGYFRSADGTMLWTGQTAEDLEKIEPGQTGTLSFSFKTFPFIDETNATNPSMNISFDVHARRLADNGAIPVEQTLTGQAQRTINFVSDVTLDAHAVYGIGPFTNTGPHPPRADEETTYTIVWRLKNTTNKLEKSTVIGELPVNVSWLGRVSPATEQVSFNPITREVTWSVGDLAEGTGYQSGAREVQFNIAIIPSITQIGDNPSLVEESEFRGVDAFTDTVVQRDHKDVTTRLEDDPFFPNDYGQVRE